MARSGEDLALEDVVAALRIAVEATEGYDALGRVAEAIVSKAPTTPPNNTGGLALLLHLQREGAFRFTVGE